MKVIWALNWLCSWIKYLLYMYFQQNSMIIQNQLLIDPWHQKGYRKKVKLDSSDFTGLGFIDSRDILIQIQGDLCQPHNLRVYSIRTVCSPNYSKTQWIGYSFFSRTAYNKRASMLVHFIFAVPCIVTLY